MLQIIWYWLRGYRTVDYGTEVDSSEAAQRAMSTLKLKARKRSTYVRIHDRRWAVMVKGYSAKEEDG